MGAGTFPRVCGTAGYGGGRPHRIIAFIAARSRGRGEIAHPLGPWFGGCALLRRDRKTGAPCLDAPLQESARFIR